MEDIEKNVKGVSAKGSQSESVHEPVLLNEIIESLITSNDALKSSNRDVWYLDGTLGGAGHALAIAGTFNRLANAKVADLKQGTLSALNILGLDQDDKAIERAKKSLATATKGKIILENENFRNLDQALDKNSIDNVDLILLDIGVSSDELENSGKGFTFMKDEPLLMTLGDPAKYPFTAKDIVNGWKEEDIANVIFAYGEERFARRIAYKIVQYRDKKKIETTMELAEIVKSAIPLFARGFGKGNKGFGGKRRIHPATKTFQALRIAVNDELAALKEGISKGFKRLAPSGRMAVITFHSLEDRIVKDYFRELATNLNTDKGQEKVSILTKKPIVPIDQEMAENPRSRSAKLRIIQKN